MIRNEKIQRYLEEKGNDTVSAFQVHFQFFMENLEEFEKVLGEKNLLDLGDGMRKYERLAEHIYEFYGMTAKNGEKLSGELVKNLTKLARREKAVREANKRRLPPEQDTVFRIFHPSDLEDEDDKAFMKVFPKKLNMLQ